MLTAELKNSLNPIDMFKSDVFTMGVVMLETGLLEYQDECYDGVRPDLNLLSKSLERLSCLYSDELCKIVGIMLDHNPATRESWL
jgi:hypothetical protein